MNFFYDATKTFMEIEEEDIFLYDYDDYFLHLAITIQYIIIIDKGEKIRTNKNQFIWVTCVLITQYESHDSEKLKAESHR